MMRRDAPNFDAIQNELNQEYSYESVVKDLPGPSHKHKEPPLAPAKTSLSQE